MKTKNLIVFVFAALMTTVSFAQKGSVAKAESYLAKSDFISAKGEIDVAITIEKTASKSRTWFTRGKIYQAIATSEDESIKAIDPEALAKCVEAYNKVLEKEKANSSYAVISTTNLDQIWGNFLNAGGTSYGEEDYELALSNFEKALLVKPEDSTTLFYTGIAAQQSGKSDQTLVNYYKMVDLGYASADIYSTIIYFERQGGNNEKALEITRAAQKAFPQDSKFGQEEISLLLAMDKLEEAKSELLSAIEEDPSNVTLHLNLGVLYDNIGSAKASEGNKEEARANYDLAKASYLKAVEIDPENFIGNFNAGVIYVNLAKEYFDEARDMDLKTYNKKGPAMEEKGRTILKEGLPLLVKALEISPDDVDGLRALQQVYAALKMYDEAEAVMNKLDALGAGE